MPEPGRLPSKTPPPAWSPDWLDLAGLAHLLCMSVRQARLLLSAGRLPPADVNVSITGGPKGRRWSRRHVNEFLAGQG